jgi:hypothetical protein
MYKLLYKLYSITFRNKPFDQLYSRILVRAANVILPVYFKATSRMAGSISRKAISNGRKRLIVSLTSFPARIDMVWLTIETILRQNLKPDAIFLNLYSGDFNSKEDLPQSFLRLQKRGLEIKFCPENLMPHLKYYYSMAENPDADIITIDDDVLYPPDLIKKLIRRSHAYPGSVICPVTRIIAVAGGTLQPYSDWHYLKTNSVPSVQNLTMGVGGAYYPAGCLDNEVFNLKVLSEFALRTDDLWLKIMSLRRKTGVASIAGEFPRFFMPVIQRSRVQLMDLNVTGENNDKVFRKLLDYWKLSPSSCVEEG